MPTPFAAPRRASLARRSLRTAALAAALAALAGCAAMQPKTPEQQVQESAQKRWDALRKADFATAWTYLSAEQREQNPKDEYGQSLVKRASLWKEALATHASCEPNLCKVQIRITVTNFMPSTAAAVRTITTYFDEFWVREDGRWRYHGTDGRAAAPKAQ